MLQLYKNRKIQFKTVETATARIVFAVLVETYGNETFISEPKIVNIIHKKVVVAGLPAAKASFNKNPARIISPFSTEFIYKYNFEIVSSSFARPPTK